MFPAEPETVFLADGESGGAARSVIAFAAYHVCESDPEVEFCRRDMARGERRPATRVGFLLHAPGDLLTATGA